MDMANKIKLGGIIFLPISVVLGILGLGFPVFFATVSEHTLVDIGEGTKTIDEEMIRQLRQNNVGPAEMLLPLASVNKRQEFADAIESKKILILNYLFLVVGVFLICLLSTNTSEVWINTI